MEHKVAIVTGSASGIGLCIAEKFLQSHIKVVFSDYNEEALEKTIKEHQDFECIGIPCDMAKEEDVKNLIQKTQEQYGRIDILVNNAGLQYVASIEDFPTQMFEKMIQVMLVGSFMSAKYAIPHMKQQNFGRVINMASINGLIGFAGKAAYNSAKHGIIGLTKVIALECAKSNITCNAICPGYVDTPLVRGQMQDLARQRGVSIESVLNEVLYPLIPQKRLIDIQDIASLALFLCNDSAKHITGQSLVIDGGYTAQ
ncbi:3-hydroxybutyrate dehydrogenase [Helicobacter mustelae]|uniref:D-beta-hydroxybutyrate dehydrogenase n=1 Tax=Helicobacter mustelae (strain ATCC 43772 / CCUG 25715 / CIP 103759 / LMG 18044 / NCTC 12198 / R85-136P) TaxID=679897 RepID=D3UIL3_HELM1|nr:3-hydroxybutyrate dehydrogenase [Helicobacter mustelae]CBG40338.1 D-beta-hydroxybutyrate dehydrogenase [Helicobacter mustelae 12198]SQH71838.1 D-beta-hydroxybutyrate dehydrogenase [Helicobacter mustelae]STP12977.1 D-beta-hydroxybutyrate dehydrogenase [Helicobacter mustelae]